MKYIYAIPLIIIGLSGCNTQSKSNSEQVAKENNAESNTYKSSLPDSAPTYKVVTTGKQPPYSFLNEEGALQGIDIDIMRLIGEEQGFKVEFYTTSWQKVFPSVVSGQKDMAISGISYNAERNEKYLLSQSYLFVPSALMYKDVTLNIKGLQDLEGRRFSGMTGSKQFNDVKNNVQNVQLTETKTMFEAYQNLIAGNSDAIAEDIHWLQYMAKSYPENEMKIVTYETKKDLSSQQIVMFNKGSDDLVKLVNDGIDTLTASGKIDEIEKKWIGE